MKAAPQEALAANALPGRICPSSYRYSPGSLAREPEIVAEVLYVAGGLYGNVEALEALMALVAREPGARLVFNGDFHWFDVSPADFRRVDEAVARNAALRGNVETEIAAEDSGAGCGCAYPFDVSDLEVTRSNRILEQLRATARGMPQSRARLGALPMNLVARVGDARVAIVHGDATSLAGWGFAHDRLDDPSHRRWIEAMFREGCVDVFASTHTCLPALRAFEIEPRRIGVVANNGAAGMPNYAGTRFGLVTRIARAPFAGAELETGIAAAGVHVEAIRLDYDHERWHARFTASWPEGSAAHASYHRRIVEGPRFARRAIAA